jgi:hypothetical protein
MILRRHLNKNTTTTTSEAVSGRPKYSSPFPSLPTLKFLKDASEGNMPGFFRPFLPNTYAAGMFGIDEPNVDIASF